MYIQESDPNPVLPMLHAVGRLFFPVVFSILLIKFAFRWVAAAQCMWMLWEGDASSPSCSPSLRSGGLGCWPEPLPGEALQDQPGRGPSSAPLRAAPALLTAAPARPRPARSCSLGRKKKQDNIFGGANLEVIKVGGCARVGAGPVGVPRLLPAPLWKHARAAARADQTEARAFLPSLPAAGQGRHHHLQGHCGH